ncbi:MAG: hypothetical protein JWQ09_1817 [Segetibacter sp.]|nr:hypothetical protein [Segetibacter sp.]
MRYMRCIVLKTLFVALTIFLNSCKKENSEISTSIVGNWELVKVQAGRTIDYPTGNGNILKFTNSNYQAFANGQLTKSGTYTIINDPTVEQEVCLVLPEDEYRNRIIYDGDNNAPKVFIQISNDTLSLLSGCFAVDAGSNTEYVRR